MSNQIIITFDGNYLSYIDSNGNLIKIPAISGGIDHQSQPDISQTITNEGMLPQGIYHVKQDEYQEIDLLNTFAGYANRGEWPGSITAWGNERVWLDPDPSTNTYGRDNFSIHGGLLFATPGSRGCIDLINNASQFFSYFTSQVKT